MHVEYNGETIEFSIVYSKRKHIRMKIQYPGLLIVEAPKNADESYLKKLVLSNAETILSKIEAMGAGPKVLADKNYEEGERFLSLGKDLPLHIEVDPELDKPIVEVTTDSIVVKVAVLKKTEIKKAMEKHYRRQCRKKIQKRIAYYQKHFKVKPRNIEIVNSDLIWGSCSSERNLRFNWRLMMAPEESIDYIVVHEMCHLVHMNHSKSFWTLVGRILPDYKIRTEWLTQNGGAMTL